MPPFPPKQPERFVWPVVGRCWCGGPITVMRGAVRVCQTCDAEHGKYS